MMSEETINLSALNQYAYCPRRCGLIYLESEFEQNVHTARGNAEHDRVDRAAHVAGKRRGSGGVRAAGVERTAGLIGKCDVVEFWPDGTVYPVEYKHGPKRKWTNDDLQLAGQALCLEEMLGRPVPAGAIYHASSHRRREVPITDELRGLVAETAEAIRAMLGRGVLPPPVNDARCRECSLKEICQPELVAGRAGHASALAELFDPGTPD